MQVAGWWALVACGGGEQARVVLDAPPPETAQLDIEAYRGRWASAAQQPDGGWAACEKGATIEFRGDKEAGYELVGSDGDELRLAPISGLGPAGGGVQVQLLDEKPVTLRWLAPSRVATLQEWYGDRAFVAPSARSVLPTVPCP